MTLHRREVVALVCGITKIPYEKLFARNREHRISHTRFVACWAIRTYCSTSTGKQVSFTAIANMFGLDHSTVIKNVQKVQDGLDGRVSDKMTPYRNHLVNAIQGKLGRTDSNG